MQGLSMALSLAQSRLLSAHLLYLTGLLFSLYHSTPLHGPNSALSSCLARSSCNSHPSPPVQFLSYWPPLYCGGVRGLQDHWEHRLFALRPEREELVSLALSAVWRVWGEKALPKQKAASGLWTGSNPSSCGSFFVSFLLAKFVWGATGWETIWLLSKIKNIILLKLIFGHAKPDSGWFERLRILWQNQVHL